MSISLRSLHALRSAAVAVALIVLSPTVLADDGWDKAAELVSGVVCTILLISAVASLFGRVVAVTLALLVGIPASFMVYATRHSWELWTAFLACYFAFLLACLFGIVKRRKRSMLEPSRPAAQSTTSLKHR
jgi:hypothetical protein